MSYKELSVLLRNLGWKVFRDEVGDLVAERIENSLEVDLMPSIRKKQNILFVKSILSVSTPLFNRAAAFIYGRINGKNPIVTRNSFPQPEFEASAQGVTLMSDEALAWAAKQDIEKGLEIYKKLPTNAKGAYPLRHLAALAILGDTIKLERYRNCLQAGERLGFVPYVTTEMIERAVLFSKDHSLQVAIKKN